MNQEIQPNLLKTKLQELLIYSKQINEIISENSLTARIEVIDNTDVLNGIIRESIDADLVLMGGRSGDFLELMLKKSLIQEITESVKCPVIWLKEYEERPSFWSALFRPFKIEGE